MLHAHFTALCVIDAELLAIEFLHCARGRGDTQASVACAPVVNLFRSCDLDLDPMTFIDEFDPHCLERYRICKYELQGFRKLSSDRQTDIHTYRIDRNYVQRHLLVVNN